MAGFLMGFVVFLMASVVADTLCEMFGGEE